MRYKVTEMVLGGRTEKEIGRFLRFVDAMALRCQRNADRETIRDVVEIKTNHTIVLGHRPKSIYFLYDLWNLQ